MFYVLRITVDICFAKWATRELFNMRIELNVHSSDLKSLVEAIVCVSLFLN